MAACAGLLLLVALSLRAKDWVAVTGRGALTGLVSGATAEVQVEPGAGKQDATRILFQPSLPYPLDDTTNVFMRPAVPVVVKQDIPTGVGEYDDVTWELGDISFDPGLEPEPHRRCI